MISIYQLIFLKSNNKKENLIENDNLRFLTIDPENYDTSSRTDKDDLDSIEICKNTDYKYFIQYISGYNTTFDRYIDTDRAVRNYKY